MPVHIIRVFREMTDMAPRPGSASGSWFYNDVENLGGAWVPNTDIFESEKEVVIRLELACVPRDHISVKIKNGRLEIAGYRQAVQPSDQVYYHQMEIHRGEFRKIISLPESLEHNEITASLADGMLDIRISKQSYPIEIPIALESDFHPKK